MTCKKRKSLGKHTCNCANSKGTAFYCPAVCMLRCLAWCHNKKYVIPTLLQKPTVLKASGQEEWKVNLHCSLSLSLWPKSISPTNLLAGLYLLPPRVMSACVYSHWLVCVFWSILACWQIEFRDDFTLHSFLEMQQFHCASPEKTLPKVTMNLSSYCSHSNSF